jgi:large subunit ribosomal protein L10
MARTVHIPCLHCEEPLRFEIMSWGQAPERVWCDEACHEADTATAQAPEAATAAARNLSINAEYPTAQTVGSLLGKGAGEAKAVGLQAAIEDEELMPDLVSKADGQVRALAAQIDDPEALPEELQDVEAPETEEQSDDQPDDTEDADADEEEAEDEDDDDDDEDGGDALGAMFG